MIAAGNRASVTMTTQPGAGTVFAVCRSTTHSFSKSPREVIGLVAGLGVDGDAHSGATVKHRSRVRLDPTAPNLRQVHLLSAELLDALNRQGFDVAAGLLGENVTTVGLDLLALPRDTRLQIGSAVLRLTGLRNPCSQLNDFREGLMNAVLARGPRGELIRKCGVMAVVEASGEVRPGDAIEVAMPAEPHHRLERV